VALELTTLANVLINEQTITPNIVLEVDGLPYIFGANPVFKLVRIGDFIIGDGTKIGGIIEDEDSRDWIKFKETTNSISQQIFIDKAESSSITSFKISLIDKNDELTSILSPGIQVDDILGREANVYWQPVGSAFPRDASEIFVGIVDRVQFGQGYVLINVAHPESLKRQEVLPLVNAKTTIAINDTDTSVTVDNPAFVQEQDVLTTYMRIDDEIVRITNIVGDTLTIVRAQLNTVANSHDDDSDVESFYRIQEKPIELTLKMLMSGSGIFATRTCERFNKLEAVITIQNALYFTDFDIQKKLGLVAGDFVTVTGATEGANNFSNRQIVTFGQTSTGSYITVDGALLVDEIESTALVEFQSKYDTLNFGCAMKPYQVDVAQFESINTLVSGNFTTYDFYIKDTINVKEFLDKEVFFPSGLYSVPRKARVSCNITVPPIATGLTPVLDIDSVTNATKLRVDRSINERFYNAIVYKYEIDSLEDKFLASRIRQSADSTNRIKVGNKVLTIESNGFRNNPVNSNLIDVQSRRYLDRYQYGAEKIIIGTNFSTGFAVEVGDTVIFEGSTLKVSDTKSGSRDFNTRIMECTNKSINLKTGEVELEITDTGYSSNLRFGTWAPSSIVNTGSTVTEIRLKKSYATQSFQLESDKWKQYINQRLTVRSEDWVTVYETRIIGIDPTKLDTLLVNALPVPPSENWIIEPPAYDDTSAREMRFYKALHCFWNPQVNVTSGTTTTIDVPDPTIFWVDAPVRIHDATYTNDKETVVIDITGSTVTLRDDLGFTPDSTYLVDLIGFSGDKGLPYAYF